MTNNVPLTNGNIHTKINEKRFRPQVNSENSKAKLNEEETAIYHLLANSSEAANLDQAFQQCTQLNTYPSSIASLLADHWHLCIRYNLETHHWKSTDYLDLSDATFHLLPNEITQMQLLRQIDMVRNYDLDFTDAFLKLSTLPNLKTLTVFENGINQLPDNIGQLKQLTHLTLESSEINQLSPTLFELNELESLNLSTNQIEVLPPGIEALQQLRELNLNTNHLTELPDEITQLHRLEQLSVGDNPLQKPLRLLDQIKHFTHLKYLDLSSLNLNALPTTIGNFVHLEELILDYNPIVQFPDELRQLQNLKKLSLNTRQGFNYPEATQNTLKQWLPDCDLYFF